MLGKIRTFAEAKGKRPSQPSKESESRHYGV